MKVNKHHERMNADIHRLLTALIPNLKNPLIKDSFITVTRVSLTQDLSYCKVYVSILTGDAQEIIKALKGASGHLRSEIFSKMSLRKSPALLFVLDEGAAYAQRINDLLNSNTPKEQQSED